MLRSSIYTVSLLKRLSKRLPKRLSTISRPAMERVPDAVVEKYDSADTRNISELQDLSHFWAITLGKVVRATSIVHKFELWKDQMRPWHKYPSILGFFRQFISLFTVENQISNFFHPRGRRSAGLTSTDIHVFHRRAHGTTWSISNHLTMDEMFLQNIALRELETHHNNL